MNHRKLWRGICALLVAMFTLFMACKVDSSSDDDEPTYYTVTFESNGGSEVKTQSVEAGKSATKPSDPTKQGFTFAGWYSDSAFTQAYDFTAAVTKSITLYANWAEQAYTVTFNTNGGSSVVVQTVAEGKLATKPADPTKDGNRFVGWYTDSALTTAFDFSAPITADITLYAKWAEQVYTVTFNTNGGSSVTEQTVAEGKLATKPADPTKDSSIFAGWYSDSALTAAFDFNTAITANITLYANWAQSVFTLTFDSNGGSDVAAQSVAQGKGANKPANPTKAGYTFDGWYSDSALTTAFDFTAGVTRDMTLYAKWSVITYTVSFSTDGGTSIAAQTVEHGATATAPTAPTKAHYTFGGWYTTSALSAEFDFTKAITADTTVYAKWNAITHSVTFSTNGGSSVAALTVTEGTSASEPSAPTKEGYTFAGWYTDSALTKAFAFATDSAALTADVTLYAKWVTATYTVTFSTDGGTSIAAQTVEHGSKLTQPTAPTKDFYSFVGWYSDSALSAAFDFNTPITANITLYAKWALRNGYYEVSFATDGGSSIAKQIVASGGTATAPIPAPTKAHYTFAGWYCDSALTTSFDFDSPITADTTLYAKWAADVYTVTFDTNGGSTIAAQQVAYNETATAPNAPTKANCDFVGWYSDSALRTAFSFATAITGNITLYAKWTPRSCTVTFNALLGTSGATQTVAYNTQATEPVAPTKEGYTFAGWYSDSTLTAAFSFTTPITADITLYAKWTPISYTVTLVTNGGTIASGKDITSYGYLERVTLPTAQDVTRSGYIFIGWYASESLTGSPVTTFRGSGNRTYYAKWLAEDTQITVTASVSMDVVVQKTENADGTITFTANDYGYWFLDGVRCSTSNRYTFNPSEHVKGVYTLEYAETKPVVVTTNGRGSWTALIEVKGE